MPARRGPELRRLHLDGLFLLRPGRPGALRRLPLRRSRGVPDRAGRKSSPAPGTVSFAQGARFGYLGTAYSALRKTTAGAGTTVLIDGISGTLGLGVCLNALALGVPGILGTGRNAALLEDVKAIAPERIEVLPAGTADLREWARERNDGEGVDIVEDCLGPGAPAESMLEAIGVLRRGGVTVDIGGMMERPALDLFSMMCSQNSVLDSLRFSTGEAQEMAELAGAGVLDLSVLEHHTFALDQINEALDDLPTRHGGFSNFVSVPPGA